MKTLKDLREKSVSQAQQKMMGMALAYKRGEMDDASPEVKKMANSMSTKDLEDFAKTKHKGLPAKKVAEGFTPKEIKMAIGVASDKRYADGNYTGAVKAIEKIKKGLSKHSQVAAVLKRQNESTELVSEAIDFFKVAKAFDDYAKKHGGIDKSSFMKVGQFVRQLGKESDVNKQDKTFMAMKKFIGAMDTDPRDGVIQILQKHGMWKNGRIMREYHAQKEGVDFFALREKKDSYPLYHKTYSGAMAAAYEYAKKKGYEVDPDDIDRKVATGPRKPSNGKTNSFTLKLKDENRKMLAVQVTNLDNKRYELNTYIT